MISEKMQHKIPQNVEAIEVSIPTSLFIWILISPTLAFLHLYSPSGLVNWIFGVFLVFSSITSILYMLSGQAWIIRLLIDDKWIEQYTNITRIHAKRILTRIKSMNPEAKVYNFKIPVVPLTATISILILLVLLKLSK